MLAPLTVTPGVPETRMPPVMLLQSMVIDLVIVTPPKPPGSRQSMVPPAAVLEIAPANVLHGAVRLHGLTSSPTPDTQVRVAWALAGAAYMLKTRGTANKIDVVIFDILNPQLSNSPKCDTTLSQRVHTASLP